MIILLSPLNLLCATLAYGTLISPSDIHKNITDGVYLAQEFPEAIDYHNVAL